MDETSGSGWKAFAAILILVGGFMNFIDGLVAISDSNYYKQVTNAAGIHLPVTDNLHTWGWVVMIWGIIMVCAGVALFGGSMWARIVGVTAASLNALLQLAFLASFPFWSFTMILVDIFVIYAIVVHGGLDATSYGWDGGTASQPRREPVSGSVTGR